MKLAKVWAALATACACAGAMAAATASAPLDLAGYADESGAITVLHRGGSVDPYFAMQALLLAHDNGVPAGDQAVRFARWLQPRQKPDGTFDRFCRSDAGEWAACKTADADDSLLAMWIRLVLTLPAEVRAQPAFSKSLAASRQALEHLYQPSRGIYMVSPTTLHGLFMDNLEVWSLQDTALARGDPRSARLARAVQDTFWDPAARRYIVSTQLEQRGQPAAFYPDAVAQIFPVMVGFPLPVDAAGYYAQWMRQHRKQWLAQGTRDYPWGIVAVLALRRGDTDSARCWLRESRSLRHTARWAVTDEVSYQVVTRKGLAAAAPGAACD